MVFSRSRAVLARHDVSSHMQKWWKNPRNDDGQVVRSLSPYEQQIVVPWLRTWPKRAYDKFMGSFAYWGTAGAIVVGTTIAADEADAAQDRSHRF